jgi:hypothetical protein
MRALLMDRIVSYLREKETQRIVGDVLTENVPMRALMHDCHFEIDRRGSDPGALRYILELRPAATVVEQVGTAT